MSCHSFLSCFLTGLEQIETNAVTAPLLSCGCAAALRNAAVRVAFPLLAP